MKETPTQFLGLLSFGQFMPAQFPNTPMVPSRLHTQQVISTFGRLNDQFGTITPSARKIPLFDPRAIQAEVKAGIEHYRAMSDSELKPLASRFADADHPALGKSLTAAPTFHERTPALNRIRFFHSAFETEIASAAEIQELPPDRRAAESTRLVAKRFIDSESGNSLFADPSIGKGNPPVRMQELPIRLIRAQAATATIGRYAGKYIQALYQHVVGHLGLGSGTMEPVTIHMVRPGREMYAHDATINFLSLAAQTEITDSLNYLARLDGRTELIRFVDGMEMPVLSRTARSNASPIGRLVQQGRFDVSEVRRGDQIIIVDDHTQAGGTILAMAAAATEAGASVIAAITPTTHPFCAQLSLSPTVAQCLDGILKSWDAKGLVQQQLAQFGMPVDTLTNHEAMIIIAYATDPEDLVATQRFLQLEKELMGGNQVMEDESGSLAPILQQKPISPQKVVEEMIRESSHSRIVVSPTPVRGIHVMDWDDFLRDEKGMNYQLMHNALATAAKNYGARHPFLTHLAQAVEQARGQYKEGLPLLCMSQEAFSQATIQNENFLKKDMVRDLLTNLGALDPGLAREHEALKTPSATDLRDRRRVVENILYHEFLRQYQQMLKRSVAAPSDRRCAPTVPFPKVAPAWMPGAEALLNDLRRPENFVALISNRGDRDLKKELNAAGWSHYFDVISGAPERHYTDRNGVARADRLFRKPAPDRLLEMLGNAKLEKADLTLWGDTVKDVTQALSPIRDKRMGARRVRGVIVNPNPKIAEELKKLLVADPTLDRAGLEIMSASTLEELRQR